MKIETKYNIGDKVRTKTAEPTEFIINTIEIVKRKNRPTEIYYMDDIEYMVCKEEEYLFPVKEELLKSL